MASSAGGVEDLPERWLELIIKKRVEEESRSPSNWSICKVPEQLRKLNEVAYSPRTISIGPIHWGKPNLQEMEAQKTLYTLSIVGRIEVPDPIETIFQTFDEAILSLEEKARDSYAEKISYDKKRLAEILLVDGCFILELFLRHSHKDSNDDPNLDDPIFASAWMLLALQHDLLLLENQIPFFVLEHLFKLVVERIKVRQPSYSLSQYALLFFQSVLNFDDEAVKKNYEASDGVMHLLDLLHKCCQPSIPKTKMTLKYIRGARKLRRAGIQFKPRQSNDIFNIKFTNPNLEIPPLRVDVMTEPLFRNLIAFEQCCGDKRKQHFSSYAKFMDYLIKNPKDEELLERKSIIKNDLGHGGDVSKLFNNLTKEVVLEDFFFNELCKDVNFVVDCYYNRWWPRNKAILKRDYCSNPWKFISIVAAAVLLILTMFQTAYTIASYYPH